MMKLNFKQKALVASVSGLLTLGMVASMPTAYASDIEIYKLPDAQQKTIMMMLDTSGSMNVDAVGFSACDIPSGTPHTVRRGRLVNTPDGIQDAPAGAANAFGGKWCQVGNVRHYDRMTRLRGALVDVVTSNKLDNSVYLGIGEFDHTRGVITVPAKPLTAEHRKRIYDLANPDSYGGSGGTPSSNAYAEVAAYMLGTTTVVSPTRVTVKPERVIPASVIPGKAVNKIYRYASGAGDSMWHCALKDPNLPANTGDGRFHASNLRLTNDGYCQTIAGSPNQSNRAALIAQGFVLEACPNNVGNSTNTMCAYRPNESYTFPDTHVPERTEAAITFDVGDSPFNNGNGGWNSIGFNHARAASDAKVAGGGSYATPLPVTGQECSGQAIYFLTDGFPNNAPAPQALMKQALGSFGTDFPQYHGEFSGLGDGSGHSGWGQMGEFAKRLRDPNRNPAKVSIPTAVVGFGGEFSIFEDEKNYRDIVDADGKTHRHYDCSKITTIDQKNVCLWGSKRSNDFPANGGYGEGGFYYAKDGSDVVNSILEVVSNIDVDFPDVITGSPTIPIDPLNRQRFLPYAYYASFRPQPASQQQLWVGNLNKYRTLNGVMVDKTLDSQQLTVDGQLNPNVSGYWGTGSSEQSGVLGKLPLRLIDKDGKKEFERKVLTNRNVKSENGTVVVENTGELKRITLADLYQATGGGFSSDPKKNYWLNVLGLNVATTANVAEADIPTQPELRQLAASMHSSPILLTQSAKFGSDGVTVDDREDYILFGSTDGMIHVVDDETGIEKFAFVPNEMMEKQPQAFLTEQSAGAHGRNHLFYGIDAPWVAHTQFVATTIDGKSGLTVRDSGRTQDSNDTGSLAVKGLQWVYGGLRMGGNSYYALDLSDIENPVLKFHIDPVNAKVYSGQNIKTFNELKNMGQSWSKPVLGYVNWDGKRRLVMFVGGGYDVGYETTNYRQTNKQGAGVYMFDANDGDLLWWASDENVSNSTAGVYHSRSADLKYSVVSRINTIDRNGDGLIDHLYFGDLGGQAFRVDLNNEATSMSNFGVRVTKLFDEHKTDGTSPRFYEMPSVSIHIEPATRQGDGKRFAVVAFSSGDRSSPYTAGRSETATGTIVTSPTAQDGVFVYYDNDVAQNTLMQSTYRAVPTLTSELQRLDIANGIPQMSAGGYNRGWKYIQVGEAGRYKGIGEPIALANILSVSFYDKDGAGLTQKCGAGVRGNTVLQRFCLPTGKCIEELHGDVIGFVGASGSETPASATTGAGIVTATHGGGTDNNGVAVVSGEKKEGECTPENRKTNPKCEEIPIPSSIKNLRWFESK